MLKKPLKIVCVAITAITLVLCTLVPCFAYGGSEIRSDIDGTVTMYRINTPRIAIGWNADNVPGEQYKSGSGHFVDNGVSWHNNRDYYGNGSIAVTNYRDNPDTTYTLPYLYNYHYVLKSDTLTYTLPRQYNWLRVHFDTYFGHSRNNDEYIELTGATNTTIVVFYNYKTLAYDPKTNKAVELEHHEEITITDTNHHIPMCPPTITADTTAYDVTITTWYADYSKITIGTSFDTEDKITGFSQRESLDLFEEYQSRYNPAPVFEDFWTSLFAGVKAFMNVEIFPDFTLGTVSLIALGMVALGIVLKFFAGG